MNQRAGSETHSPQLIRGMGLKSATALNIIDMIGVGPFITIPLIIHAMGGPQAMLGWIIGGLFAICDGLVWSELGAAMPRAGGSYEYLKEIYGPKRFGRLASFLYIWQLTFSAPLSIASGCIGLALYATHLWPALEASYLTHTFSPLGVFEVRLVITRATIVAMGACLLAVLLLYGGITRAARISRLLWVGVAGTLAWVIFAGLTHFDGAKAFDFPAGAFTPTHEFFMGLGAAMLVATYDYWGYYNACFLGAEVKEPHRNIPRAVMYSILLVVAIYIVMNISILGVIPWRELDQAAASDTRFYVISTMMERTYGAFAGNSVAVLIIWTAFASVFSLLLGYSRVPYAAALDGNYFKSFASLHPKGQFPHVSLLVMGFVAILFCTLRLADVIAALVVIRIMVQFLLQTIGVMVLRVKRPEMHRPFRIWLYPWPPLLATFGFLYVAFARKMFLKEVAYAAVIVAIGVAIFMVRSWRRREWPFAIAVAEAATTVAD